MSRRTRGKRQHSRPVQLTERDLDIFTLVGLTRYIAAEQLAAELFPSADRARRRVRQLFDARYLKVTLAGSTRPNLISLTRAGLTALRDARPGVAERIYLPGAIKLAGIPHHLAIIDVRLYLSALAAGQGGELMTWCNAGGHLADEWGLTDAGLQPDGLALVRLHGDHLRLAIEVDLGTEAPGVVAGKLQRYATLDATPCALHELWVVATGGACRTATLRERVRDAGLAHLTRLIPAETVRARPLVPPPPLVDET